MERNDVNGIDSLFRTKQHNFKVLPEAGTVTLLKTNNADHVDSLLIIEEYKNQQIQIDIVYLLPRKTDKKQTTGEATIKVDTNVSFKALEFWTHPKVHKGYTWSITAETLKQLREEIKWQQAYFITYKLENDIAIYSSRSWQAEKEGGMEWCIEVLNQTVFAASTKLRKTSLEKEVKKIDLNPAAKPHVFVESKTKEKLEPHFLSTQLHARGDIANANEVIRKLKAGIIHYNHQRYELALKSFNEAKALAPEEAIIADCIAVVEQKLAANNQINAQFANVESTATHLAKIKQLVFQGGGVKGIGYVSALEALEANGLQFNQLEQVAGTSAGAIQALLMSLGYELPEMKAILAKTNFEEFLNGAFRQEFFKLYQNVEGFKDKLTEITDKGSSTSGALEAYNLYKSEDVQIIKKGFEILSVEKFGLFDGEYIRQWLEDLVCNKIKTLTGRDLHYLTFSELHELREKYPVLKDLYLIGTNTTLGKLEVFCHETTPDVVISDAVRISMSIPFLFRPHHVYIKNQDTNNLPKPDKAGHLYIDGGVVDNYPIWLFDSNKYCKTINAPEGNFQNPATLGLRLVDKGTKLQYESVIPMLQEAELPQQLLGFVTQVLKCFYEQQEMMHQRSSNEFRTIYIDHKGISTAEFNLDAFQKDLLLYSGQKGVQDFLQRRELTANNTNQAAQAVNLAAHINTTNNTNRNWSPGFMSPIGHSTETNLAESEQDINERKQQAEPSTTPNNSNF